MVYSSEWSLPIAAEQIERPPSKREGPRGVAAQKEPAVVNEPHPTLCRNVNGRLAGIKLRYRLGPSMRLIGIKLDNGGLFILRVGKSLRRLVRSFNFNLL